MDMRCSNTSIKIYSRNEKHSFLNKKKKEIKCAATNW